MAGLNKLWWNFQKIYNSQFSENISSFHFQKSSSLCSFVCMLVPTSLFLTEIFNCLIILRDKIYLNAFAIIKLVLTSIKISSFYSWTLKNELEKFFEFRVISGLIIWVMDGILKFSDCWRWCFKKIMIFH